MIKCPACGGTHTTRGVYKTELIESARHFECEDCGFLVCAATDEIINFTVFEKDKSKVSLGEGAQVRITGLRYGLYCQDNGVGGRIYWSDEVGEGVHVWDTSLVHVSTLVEAIAAEFENEAKEFSKRHGGEKIPRKHL